MECKKCGNVLPENAKFCFECGTKVEQEVVCITCGAIMPAEYKFCMECGTPLEGSHDNVNKKNVVEEIESPAEADNELEELRKNIINMLLEEYNWDNHEICVELQKGVVYTGTQLIDLRELSTVEQMKKDLGDDLCMVGFWHSWWSQWKKYVRELGSVRWISKLNGSIFYYITGEGLGDDPYKSTKLHMCSIGANEEGEIKTWSNVRVYRDIKGNIRILANNIEQSNQGQYDWILLDETGEVLWETKEYLSGLRTRAEGLIFDCCGKNIKDINNISFLLDFYSGNVLLREYSTFEYYIQKLNNRMVIEACKLLDEGEQYELYHYENGNVTEFSESELKECGVKILSGWVDNLENPCFEYIGNFVDEVNAIELKVTRKEF